MTVKLTNSDIMVIETALLTQRKILEDLQKRTTKRELAHSKEIFDQRQGRIDQITEVLAKLDAADALVNQVLRVTGLPDRRK